MVSGVLSALLAFIFSLADLVDMMSIGTLLAYSVVALCVLILRYKPGIIGLIKEGDSSDSLANYPKGKESEISREDVPLLGMNRCTRQPSQTTANLALAAIMISTVSMLALGALITWGSDYLSLVKWWAVLLLAVIILFLIGCTLLLLWLPQNETPLPFMVPFVPVLPLVSVFINVFLMLKLSYLTWLRFAVWMLVGKQTYL